MATFSNFVNDPHLHEFLIELTKKDACFEPGEVVTGRVVLRSKQNIEAESLKIVFYGGAKVKIKTKANDNSVLYLNHQLESISETQQIPAEKAVVVQFEEPLPTDLITSLESKNASVMYTVRAQLKFKSEENEMRTVTALKGITIVEKFDLNVLPKKFFEPPSHHLAKKFGMFSCTGGQIKLHFTICRSAFVCGENISIEGRIENKTDRRVDKVAAVLQQVVILCASGADGEESETSILDVSDIHEDNLALFVDEGQSIRIERNFAIPALPPSTLVNDLEKPDSTESHSFLPLTSKKKRMSLSTSRLSFSSVSHKFPVIVADGARLFKILYQLSIKVKTGGVEVMEINVPIVVGSVPYQFVLARTLGQMTEKEKARIGMPLLPEEKTVTYRQSRKDRPVLLATEAEHYLCNRAQLNFVNRYPLFGELPTSSKQSRKVNVLANTIKAESNFIQSVRRDENDSMSYSSEQTIQLPNSVMDY